MKSKVFSVVCAGLLPAALGLLMSSCQTAAPVDQAASVGTKGDSLVQACQRLQNRRSACEDEVGCAWDYNIGNCAPAH